MALTQKNFRWRTDDGSETAATWKAAADTNITLPRNQLGPPVRLRINVITDAATTPTLTAQLMYSKNGGAWTTTNASTAVVVPTASAFVANAAATTEQLSAKAGANWRAGEIDSNNGLASYYFGSNGIINDESECEFSFTLLSADLAVGDTVDLRLESGTGTVNAWTVTPRVTISAAVGAAVGAPLTTVAFPLRHAGLGPYRSSAGNEYFFGRDSVNTGQVEPHKASDPMSSFTAQTAKTMSSGTTTAIEAAACYPVGDVIHVVTQISTGQVFYNSYNMSTDAWTLTTSETAVAAASFAPNAGNTFVSCVVRSGGEVVIGYCAGLTAMSSGFHMVRYTRRTGTNTFSSPVNVDNGGSNNWSGPISIIGASDRVHYFLRSGTAGTAGQYQRTLSAANALQTFPSSYEVSIGLLTVGPGVSYNDAGTTKVRAPTLRSATGAEIVKFDSADTPTVTTEAAGDADPTTQQNQTVHLVAADDTTIHMLYSNTTTQDLFHDSSTGGGGAWGTDTNELTATINRISANVYDRSGKKLAMVVDDGGVIKYAEILLPASLIYPTNDVLTQLRRR